MKTEISQVADLLKRHKIEPAVVREIIEELNARAESEPDKEPTPRAKTQYVIVANADKSLGWVVQMPEGASPHTVLDRVNKAAAEFNATKAGRAIPVKTVGEAFESCKRKLFKNNGLQVKTKTAVYIIQSDNKLREEPSV